MIVGCGPRESKDGGECIYNCAPNDGMFCRVEFERLITGSLGNLKGLCFKNKACFGTPKACLDCNLKCEGYSGGCSATTSTPGLSLDKPPIKVSFPDRTPTEDLFPDKSPIKVLFPDKPPIKDLSTGVSVEETHCLRRASDSRNSPCLVSTKIT